MSGTNSLIQPDPNRLAPHLPVPGAYLFQLFNGFYSWASTVATLGLAQLPSGHFYADQGALVNRVGDRLLVGAAVDNQADANRSVTPTDWLSAMMGATSIGAWATWGATTASIARYGNIGLLGASRTSDAEKQTLLGYTPSSIGVAAWAIDDDTASPRKTNAYGFYAECWRMPGAVYQPSFGMELEAVNLGGPAVGVSTPYNVNIGGGTYLVQLGAGGGQTASAVSPGEAAITLVNNPSTFNRGIIFGAAALSGTDGATGGYGSAIEMAAFQGISWQTPEVVQNVPGNNSGAFIRSIVTLAAQGGRMEFQNGQIVFTNNSGQALFALPTTTGTPTNILTIQPGSGQGAAGIYVEEGANGSPNLGLYPASGGELQIQSVTTAPGNPLTASEQPVGWLHMNINGADVRIPYFTPAQAGG